MFHAAGGMAFLTRELLQAGLLHGDVLTNAGVGLADYTMEPWLDGETLRVAAVRGEVARHDDPAAGVRAIRGRRRHPPAERIARAGRHQDIVRAA